MSNITADGIILIKDQTLIFYGTSKVNDAEEVLFLLSSQYPLSISFFLLQTYIEANYCGEGNLFDMDPAYKKEHENFITGHSGTTFPEIVFVTGIPCVGCLLRHALQLAVIDWPKSR